MIGFAGVGLEMEVEVDVVDGDGVEELAGLTVALGATSLLRSEAFLEI